MFDLRAAQIVTKGIEREYVLFPGLPVKWDSVYDDEEEILNDLYAVHVPKESELHMLRNIYSGYEYIHSFARRVQNGFELSDKQMLQAKRLALEIKKAASIIECWK